MTYQDKMKRIEEITNLLESDNCEFEESVKLYEEASLLIKECYETVNKCDGKIKEISEDLLLLDFNLEKQ